MQKKIAGLKELKIKIIKRSKEKKMEEEQKKGGKRKTHRTAKAQCRGRVL